MFYRILSAEEIANDEELWDDHINPSGEEPLDGMDYSERVDYIMEHYPDTPRTQADADQREDEENGITVTAAASAMGRRTSEAKAAAARRNGRKGGRPRKSK